MATSVKHASATKKGDINKSNRLKPFPVAVHRSLLAVWNGTDFLTMYSANKLGRFPSCIYEASTLALSKIWKSFAPYMQEKASRLVKYTIDHELALPLPAFPGGDVSGKVWPTLITTQQVGIYLKVLLGFTTYHANSPTPIYWRITQCVYSLSASILTLHVPSVKKWCNKM